jgi:pantothenate kinase type III
MPEIGNSNIVTARLDPDRMKRFGKMKRRREKKGDVIKRAIDALWEKEGRQS